MSKQNDFFDKCQLPTFTITELRPPASKYAVVIPVWNQGQIILDQLLRMQQENHGADIVIVDSCSTDGSCEPNRLRQLGVRTILLTTELGLGSALRIGLAYAMTESYQGTVLIDGNGKDGTEAIADVINKLEGGFDLVQCSRFMPGGVHENTPLDRVLGIKLVICPLLALRSGFSYSDPTNGFKGLSRRLLLDSRVRPFRKVFSQFNLQFYLNYAAPRLGFQVCEIPVSRVYPKNAPTPTKIVGLWPRLVLVLQLLQTVLGRYDPGTLQD